jgi:hypothetical protein
MSVFGRLTSGLARLPGLSSLGSGAGKATDAVGGLFDPRSEGQYAGVDRGNFDLPGQQARGIRDEFLGHSYGMRSAPQAQYDPYWRQQQQGVANYLNQSMNGQNSLAQFQLRGATDANIAQQRSLAASAGPGNAAMAQRMAMQNIGRINQGLGSQAAQLGIQERNAAAMGLAGLSGQARGQDMQGSQFNVGAQLQQTGMNDAASNGAFNRELAGAQAQQQGGMGYEQSRTQRAVGAISQPTQGEGILGAAMGGLGLALSDERKKQSVKAGEQAATSFLSAIQPKTYEYSPAGMQSGMAAPGTHLGVMAQDLERTPVGRAAVQNTPAGKVVDYGQLGGTMLAGLAALNSRLNKVESTAQSGNARTKQTARKSY